MLRAALPLSRRAVLVPARHGAILHTPIVKRTFADSSKPDLYTKASIRDTNPVVLPGTQSKTATAPAPRPPGAVPPSTSSPNVSTADKSIPPANVPLTPPPPPGDNTQKSPTISVPPPGPPNSPPAKKKPRRFRRFLLTLILLTGLGFGGGVWYSLISDNFHDFFTEYVPFGEDAVLYFEEREFRKRFPNVLNSSHRPSGDSGPKVTISSQSGLSSRITESNEKESDLESKGRHMSAVDDNKAKSSSQSDTKASPAQTSTEKPKPKDVKKSAPSTDRKPKVEESKAKARSTSKEASTESTKASAESKRMPEVDEPNVFIPIARIDPLKIKDADEPLVQDLVKILNDIITVVNADNSTGKFNSSITKAKNQLASVGKRILDLKVAEKKSADEKLKATHVDFEKSAREFASRVEDHMREEESKWRDEFESERQKIAHAYEERLKLEIEKSKQLSEQRIRNQLLEQAVSLKKDFVSNVKDQVESERDGRLAKLSELSTSINELENLTSQWNSVLDANLRTQHLQVAVEAVRSSLERTNRPKPFIRELAALKELAAEDSVVNSAIASINPTAYQIGVPTSSQLIDRFRRVADEVRKASLLPEDAGVASHAVSLLLSKVMFKKHGRAIGDDVESILTRTETLLEEGNLDEATREMNTLTGWAKTLSRDWLGEARKVLEVRQALDVISTEVRLQSLKVD